MELKSTQNKVDIFFWIVFFLKQSLDANKKIKILNNTISLSISLKILSNLNNEFSFIFCSRIFLERFLDVTH